MKEAKVLLELTMVENPDGEIDLMIDPDELTGHHLDQLVKAICKFRGQYKPPVPETPPQNLSEIPVVSGAAAFLGEVFPHGSVIGVRHPALGWVAFQVSPEFLAAANGSSSASPSKDGPKH
ncbi:hypothetical protein [Acidovorax sp. SUPP2539]|uniref:hypothetical protein n=1 Tax=Acidovorax sp. SUPP2539 TaxID=2920878 RepID=UPI0023DE5EEB|nr:hypothetical protein [Acidovorax sp. SUPP2539]GKS91193.1 hypothetical protein AVTE2539_17530 [Acidovorax sp. SUPP2539]